MQTKLTLSIEEAVIERAKAYAKKQGTSLSKIVQEFLRQKAEEVKDEIQIPEEFKDIFGALELPNGLTVEEARLEYLTKKHG